MNNQKLSLVAVGRPLSQPHGSNNFGAVVSTVLSAFLTPKRRILDPIYPSCKERGLLFPFLLIWRTPSWPKGSGGSFEPSFDMNGPHYLDEWSGGRRYSNARLCFLPFSTSIYFSTRDNNTQRCKSCISLHSQSVTICLSIRGLFCFLGHHPPSAMDFENVRSEVMYLGSFLCVSSDRTIRT